MRLLRQLLLVTVLVAVGCLTAFTPTDAAQSADFPLAAGHFYTQASGPGQGARGFRITDEDGIPFWTAYTRLGGPDVLGYPISRRFVWDGLIVQATQRAVLQWQPDVNRVVVLNLMDKMHELGLDGWLAERYGIPRPLEPAAFEQGLPWSQVVARRLALLDADPAIRSAFYSVSAWADPLEVYGLPTSYVEDKGSHSAIRLQRAVIQHWKVDVPGVQAGQVTIAPVGEMAKSAGLMPPAAQEAVDVRDSTLPDLLAPSLLASRIAEAARPSVVRLVSPNDGFGSGFFITSEGHILTSAHVVGNYRQVMVELLNGVRLPGTVLGKDTWTDVAVVKVAGATVSPLPLGSSDALSAGSELVALGYSPLFANTPEARFGSVVDLAGTTMPGVRFGLVHSDVYLQPGDSGGPLLNLRGEVVGVNDAIRLSGGANGRLISTTIAIDRVRKAIAEIIANGAATHPWLGLTVGTVVPEESLPTRGALILGVAPDSPAQRAGLSTMQSIIRADGLPVSQPTDLQLALSTHTVGDSVMLEVVGENGVTARVRVHLEAAP